jgi:outer membrane protein assembly factor BamB
MRRRTLLAGLATATTGLAGCAGDPGGSQSPAGSPTDSPTDPPTDRTPDDPTGPPGPLRWRTDVAGTAGRPEHVGATLTYVDGEGPVRDHWLFVPTDAGTLSALDPATGKEWWSASMGDPVRDVTVAADAGLVLARAGRVEIAADHVVRAFDAAGAEQWEFPTGAEAEPHGHLELLGADGGRVFVATRDDAVASEGERLYALEAGTGGVAWHGEVGDPSSAAITDDAVFVASYGAVDAYRRPDGERLWRFAPEGVEYQYDTLRADDERAYFATTVRSDPTAGRFHALDATTGDPAWERDRFVTSDTLADGLYLGGDGVLAVDPATGEETWTGDGASFLVEGPVRGDTLYAGGDGIAAYATADGDERWSWSAPADIVTPTAVGEAGVYASTGGGDDAPPVVYARATTDGSERWTFEADAAPTDPVLGDLVYVAAGATVYGLAP